MSKFRTFFLIGLLIGIASLSLLLFNMKEQPPFARSFAPLFQELGKPIQSVDRMISRVVPISEIDEKMLGEEIRQRVAVNATPQTVKEKQTVTYLNSLVTSINDASNKPFQYEVFLVEGPPNAYAMPGGTICVTKGLLELLESEAELVSILGHEIGHVERGHLFNLMRGEMLRRKIKEISIITYVDEIFHFVGSISYSKTQEDEADEYGFRLLVDKGYDPFSMSRAFKKILLVSNHHRQATNPVVDFFTTHPYTEHRIDKFYNLAKRINVGNRSNKQYIGVKNLEELQTSFQIQYPDEWVVH
jgi:beta-barrel assembly-enhancing protease